MRLLLDEDAGWLDLKRALLVDGHDVARSVDLLGQAAPDEEVLKKAIAENRIVITFNGRDFLALQPKYPDHPGMLLIYRDNLPSDMTMTEIVAAVRNADKTYPNGFAGMCLNCNAFSWRKP